MKKVIAVAVLAVASMANAQSGNTETWTNGLIYCPNASFPNFFCHVPTSDGGSLTFNVYVQSDGTFTDGHISKSNASGVPEFSSTNWSGKNLSGTFSGTNPDGIAFSGNNSEVVSTCHHYWGGGRVGRRLVTVACVTGGTGSVTFGPSAAN